MSIKQERRDIAALKKLFKRYDDEKHWGLFIPIGHKRWLTNVWDTVNDDYRPPAYYRMHLCITVKRLYVVAMRFREYRVRIGMQYL